MGAVKIILHPVYVVKISTLRMGCSKKDFKRNKTSKSASKATKKFDQLHGLLLSYFKFSNGCFGLRRIFEILYESNKSPRFPRKLTEYFPGSADP